MTRALSIGLIFFVTVLWSAISLARQDDERLPALFDTLLATASIEEASQVEKSIWGIWTDSGRDDVNRLMARGIQAMSYRLFDVALESFDEVIELDPEFAEGWNKRATLYWLIDDFAASMDDIRHTLVLEPRHFGAIAGMGLIFLERGDATGALQAFEAVLKINPLSPSAQGRVQQLRDRLQGDSV